MKPAVNVAITGAAGQIGYALAFRVASGQMLGADTPVNLHLLEVTPALPQLAGVVMELNDCAFPTLNKIVATDDARVAFKDCQAALLVGARPRGPGMERKDLLMANAQIFSAQGKAMNEVADRNIRVLVVGNPANTNAMIARANAKDLNPRNFTAMTRLDHNRAVSQLAEKTGSHVTKIRKMLIWGNHSATQYPDLNFCTVDGKAAHSLVDRKWYEETFIPTVQQRGAAIIKARGASSAASAASAAIDHMRDWHLGTAADNFISMAVPSDGSYGIKEGVVYSYPVTTRQRRLQDRAGSRRRRLLAQAHGCHRQGTARRARRRQRTDLAYGQPAGRSRPARKPSGMRSGTLASFAGQTAPSDSASSGTGSVAQRLAIPRGGGPAAHVADHLLEYSSRARGRTAAPRSARTETAASSSWLRCAAAPVASTARPRRE